MNRKHLLWIIPLCLLFGSVATVTFFQYLFDTTALYIAEKSALKLNDAMLAWEEKPLSNVRVFYQGQFCYGMDCEGNQTGGGCRIVCPQRAGAP